MSKFKKITRILAPRRIVIAAFIFAFSQSGYCLMIPSTAVGLVGTEGNGKQVFVQILDNSAGCLYNGVYFTDPKEQSRTLAVAIAAKAAGRTVRIDYNKVGNTCIGYSIYQN